MSLPWMLYPEKSHNAFLLMKYSVKTFGRRQPAKSDFQNFLYATQLVHSIGWRFTTFFVINILSFMYTLTFNADFLSTSFVSTFYVAVIAKLCLWRISLNKNIFISYLILLLILLSFLNQTPYIFSRLYLCFCSRSVNFCPRVFWIEVFEK